MEQTKIESLPPPPGVIRSIRAGFDAIAAHITAILLPLVLDLFLWLGPRLSMQKLFLAIQPEVISVWRNSGVTAEDIKRFSDLYAEVLPKINLFWLIRVFPVGITSLLYGRDVLNTPFGTPFVIQITSDINLLGWMFGLTLIGWIGGGLYFRSVAWLVTAAPPENVGANDQTEPVGTGRAIGQTILLSIFWSGIALIVGIPVFIVLSLLLQFNTGIAQIAILLFSFLSMWLVVPLFFWPHGIFVHKQNALLSMFSSLRMTRFTLPTSSMFVLTVFLLGAGLNFLWSIPPEDSWVALIGILGHAFVTTALLAASFIYYRDMNIWLQTVFSRLKGNALTKQT